MATQASNQELQEQLDNLRKDFAEVTKTLREMTSAYAKESQDRVKVGQAQDQVKESFGKVQSEVESHPYSSMAVAFGVGLVLGKILDR
jgi:ElaB/YqjD/DUF883 family membrane-anchored ribosome-binding protein